MAALPDTSDINLFGYGKRVVDFDTEVTHRVIFPQKSGRG